MEPQEPSDVETPEAITTPSRVSRKRARATEPTAPAARNTRRKIKDTRPLDREDTEGTEPHEQSDAETEPAMPSEAEIIANLKVADRHVNITEDYANNLLDGHEHVPGYGKLAGRDWTYIIRKVEVNIGRPEVLERLPIDDGAQASGPSARTVIDIDLGPDRQVSRSHAIISYDSENMQWFIVVNGRNGLRVDNNLLKRGAKSYLRNGSVIEIANTQMAFITISNDPSEGPIWDGSIIRQAQKSSEDDDDGEDDPRMNNFRSMGLPGARNSIQDSTVYTADFGGQQRRTHPHSNALQGAPGTPMRNQHSFMKSSPGGANYSRGVMMESTETIDYADDSAKDLKPPHSYAQLIGMAILSTPEQQMTLNNIYKWIMANYAFYRFNTGGWQNSIRHNLSLNKAFTKIARRTDEPGKGMKWMIEPSEFDNFVQQGMKGCRRPNPLPGTQSTLGSPNSPMNLLRQGMNGIKKDEEITPPMNAYRMAYPAALEAYTPDRGSKRAADVGLGINGEGPEYDYQSRSTPRNGLTAIANAAGSPPALFVNEEPRAGILDTPFPFRPTQRLAPPSTLKRPSDFIQFSSPAPFWKMEGLAGSTPFKPYDLSPLKTPSAFKKEGTEVMNDGKADSNSAEEDPKMKEASQETEPKPKGSPVIASSSPPRPNSSGNGLEGSPTMSRPATAVAKTLSQLAAANKETGNSETPVNGGANDSREKPSTSPPLAPTQAPSAPTSATSNTQTSTTSAANGYTSQHPTTNHTASYSYTTGPVAAQPNGFHDDGEEDGIDLAK